MASVRLTRVVEFEAAHRIRRPDKSEAENRAAFGKAAADHAHRYQVRVTVRGPLVAEAGGGVNLAALDRALKEEITDRLSAGHINDGIPELAGGHRLALAEALASYIGKRLPPRVPVGVRAHAV